MRFLHTGFPLTLTACVFCFGALQSACSDPEADSPSSGGTGPGSGGASGSGGALGTGGINGGTTASGGQSPTGGAGGASGGAASGGQPMTGGTAGIAPTGGGGGSAGALVGGAGSGGSQVGGSAGEGGASAGAGGKGGNGGGSGSAGKGAIGGSGGGSSDPLYAKFSFFVASLPALAALSGKAEGFGGDLRFNKSDGLAGADEICRQVAERGMPGAGQKQWRAFLSVTAGPGGTAVNARDRIGPGPWYDRMGRLVAMNLDGLFAGDRPSGEAALVNDLTNENGDPNHYVGPNGRGDATVDNHDTLTGSDAMGRLRASGAADTCNDWTSTTATGRPWIGHSWPRSQSSGRSWVSDHQVPGCAAGVDRTLGGTGSGSCIGCSGGYGGFYCFALPP